MIGACNKPGIATLLIVWFSIGGAALAESADALTEAEMARVLEIEQERVDLIARISAAYVRIGGGSGVVISPEGLMVTNHHVVSFKKEHQVQLPGGRAFNAQVLGNDTRGDLSVLQIQLEEGQTLTACPLGDSDDLVVGEEVIAMGNPFSYAWDAMPTISSGIVSAFHRNQGGYSDAIQTDAPINPGNSGGPLLNLRGEVIGINGRVATAFPGRWNTSVAFAIPANQIRRFLPAFAAARGGRVSHGTILGLKGAVNEHNNARGTRVTQVDGQSPAENFGFKVGDLIVTVDDMPTPTFVRLQGVLGTYPVGSSVKVKALRQGGEIEIVARVEQELGPPPAGAMILGIRADIDAEQQPGDTGILVEDVLEGYGAADADVHPDDRILKVNGEAVQDVEALAITVDKLVGQGLTSVTLSIQREGNDLEIPVELRPYVETPRQ